MSKQYVWDNIRNAFSNNSTFHYFRCTKADWDYYTDNGYIRMGSEKRIIYIDFYNKLLISYYNAGHSIQEDLFYRSDHKYGEKDENFKIIDYDIDNPQIMDKWLFFIEDNSGGGGGGEITGDLIINHINSDYVYLEKKQIRPTDHSQGWIDTDEMREDPDRPPEIGSCKCTDEFQWIKDGTMCDGTNLCEREKYQVKSNCSSNWVDYSPTVYRLGSVITYDSEECGTMEYKEEWSTFCGSYIKENYPNSSVSSLYDTSKYKILLPYIKHKNETEWVEFDCGKFLDIETVKTNSFECGWSTTRSETLYDDYLCGSVVKTKYPSLADKVSNENKYKVRYYRKHTTLPYPQNTDEMTEDQWLWGDWEYYGYEIASNYGGYCECGYKVYEWRNSGNYICGSAISNPTLAITRIEGNWIREGNAFKSNKIYDGKKTVERIYFTTNDNSLTLNFVQSSEICCDYLIVSKIDTTVVNSTSSSNNFGNAKNQNNGSFVIPTPTDGKEHFIELMYRKDGSVSKNNDNVIVTFNYDSTSSYEIWERWETCTETKTGEIEYRNGVHTCECGYRVYGYKIDSTIGYEYVCGDDINKDSGYMYYKEYKYEQCEDGSNFKWHKDDIRYIQASHSSSYECIFDPETNANTTKQTYRTFYNENTKAYEAVLCPNKIIISTSKKSYDCGWATQWIKVGEICCGELERTGATPTFTITRVEGNWIKQGNTFTSNKIYKNETTIEKIYFKGNGFIRIDYDQDSENGYDYAYIYEIDSESSINTNLRYETTGSTYIAISQNDNEEHFIKVSYQKDYSGDEGRDNVILTFSPSYAKPNCEMYGKYEKDEYQYTTDGGKTWNSFSPQEFRYGSQIEYQSEDCGFIPKLTQWKLICPDITYETAQVGDGCVICDKYNNAPTMFAIEKKQYSEDGGHTWIDAEPLEGNNIRTEKVLKWKAPKCGYTGDTFETRYTNEVCENGDLYGDSARWVSSDNGQTWIKIEGSEKYHVLMEKNSNKCEQPPTT